MTTDRLKELQKTTAYPESISVYQALFQVWVELEQDFKSRTCDNCHYGDTETKGTIICRHYDDAMPFHVPLDFGCNKFKRKE